MMYNNSLKFYRKNCLFVVGLSQKIINFNSPFSLLLFDVVHGMFSFCIDPAMQLVIFQGVELLFGCVALLSPKYC